MIKSLGPKSGFSNAISAKNFLMNAVFKPLIPTAQRGAFMVADSHRYGLGRHTCVSSIKTIIIYPTLHL